MSDPQEGSPAWRDAQQKQFDALVSNPDGWQFRPSKEEIGRVIQAHSQYTSENGDIPDASGLRLIISHQFTLPSPEITILEDGGSVGEGPNMDVKSMLSFWATFAEDMPSVLKTHMGLGQDLLFVWVERKVTKIVQDAGLALRTWQEVEITANVKSVDNLRRAATELESAEKDGYELYNTGMDQVKFEVVWNLRKGKTILGVTK